MAVALRFTPDGAGSEPLSPSFFSRSRFSSTSGRSRHFCTSVRPVSSFLWKTMAVPLGPPSPLRKAAFPSLCVFSLPHACAPSFRAAIMSFLTTFQQFRTSLPIPCANFFLTFRYFKDAPSFSHPPVFLPHWWRAKNLPKLTRFLFSRDSSHARINRCLFFHSEEEF